MIFYILELNFSLLVRVCQYLKKGTILYGWVRKKRAYFYELFTNFLQTNAMLVTILDSDLRASEATGITLGNVSLKDGYIRVMGKGDKECIVPIGKFVQMMFLHYIEKARPQPYVSDCDKLFLSRSGKPITVNTVKLVFSRLAKNSRVNRLHAHLYRHTFAINYLLNGGDLIETSN